MEATDLNIKNQAEIDKLRAEVSKLREESQKIKAERIWYPIVVAGSLIGGSAGITIAIIKLFSA